MHNSMNHLNICRIGKAGTLTLEQGPTKAELGSVTGMAKGSNTVLDLHPLTTKFYAGGLPEANTVIIMLKSNGSVQY